YDNSDGVSSGQYDFYGVVAHEFTEILGRMDLFGATIGGTPNGYDLFDMFHYTAPGVHTFTGTSTNYFSINNGTTNLDNFNLDPTGDPGDWAGSAGNDSFRAFSGSGVANGISQADLATLSALGYSLVSPTSFAVVATTAQAVQGGSPVTLLASAPTISDATSS